MSVSDRVVVLRDGRVGFEHADQPRRPPRRSCGTWSAANCSASAGNTRSPPTRRCCSPRPDVEPGPTARSATTSRSGRARSSGSPGSSAPGAPSSSARIVRADPGCRGTVTIDGKHVDIRSPNGSRDAGIAFIPEDRKHQGLALQMPAYANIALTAASSSTWFGPFTS